MRWKWTRARERAADALLETLGTAVDNGEFEGLKKVSALELVLGTVGLFFEGYDDNMNSTLD